MPGGKIAVSSNESVNTQVNTLIHEIAHELLHKESKLSKQQKKIQAEGIAYVVTLYDADYRKMIEDLKAIA